MAAMTIKTIIAPLVESKTNTMKQYRWSVMGI